MLPFSAALTGRFASNAIVGVKSDEGIDNSSVAAKQLTATTKAAIKACPSRGKGGGHGSAVRLN
jgi:hypothetical protein